MADGVYIAYLNWSNYGDAMGAQEIASRLRESGLNVHLSSFANLQDFLDDQEYSPFNFVIIHLKSNLIGIDFYDIADRIKNKDENSVLIAESTTASHGSREVLQHFDEYTGLIHEGNALLELLKKYAFVSQDFKLS